MSPSSFKFKELVIIFIPGFMLFSIFSIWLYQISVIKEFLLENHNANYSILTVLITSCCSFILGSWAFLTQSKNNLQYKLFFKSYFSNFENIIATHEESPYLLWKCKKILKSKGIEVSEFSDMGLCFLMNREIDSKNENLSAFISRISSYENMCRGLSSSFFISFIFHLCVVVILTSLYFLDKYNIIYTIYLSEQFLFGIFGVFVSFYLSFYFMKNRTSYYRAWYQITVLRSYTIINEDISKNIKDYKKQKEIS